MYSLGSHRARHWQTLCVVRAHFLDSHPCELLCWEEQWNWQEEGLEESLSLGNSSQPRGLCIQDRITFQKLPS